MKLMVSSGGTLLIFMYVYMSINFKNFHFMCVCVCVPNQRLYFVVIAIGGLLNFN